MIIVDAHEDIAFNWMAGGRDWRRSALDIRREEAGQADKRRAGLASIGLPESLAGNVAVICATLFTAPRSRHASAWDSLSYSDAREAYDLASSQLDYYERLADEHDQIALVTDREQLDAVLATWEDGRPESERQVGLVILMENADPIIEPEQFEEWYARGVRIVGPAWTASRYCGGTGQPGPLTDEGRELLEIMAEFSALLDLSHMAEEACREALDRYEGPVFASHSNPRRFCATDRHLEDGMIRQLAERDGVCGTVLFNRFLSNHWSGPPRLPLDVVLQVIDHVCQLTGSADHVGIGSDLDGGFGAESAPAGIDTVADIRDIGSGLAERGYQSDDISAIMNGNMLRMLRTALPEG
ncbi:MAG: membrane dipeptidase [Anaerolineaceae bacterium]|nr:membrane dipeptidase [Anaerolineaceae bacterium]